MKKKALFDLAMEISAEDPARRGMIYGPAPYWDGGEVTEGYFIIGKWSVMGVPEHIPGMRLCPDENANRRMIAAASVFVPPDGADAAGYNIKPAMLRKGIRAVTLGRYSHDVVYRYSGECPAFNARLLLRNLEALKSSIFWVYTDPVEYAGKTNMHFRPGYVFELGDADYPGAVWVAQLPMNYDGPAGFTDCVTKEHLAL